jgi:hypothetical protein
MKEDTCDGSSISDLIRRSLITAHRHRGNEVGRAVHDGRPADGRQAMFRPRLGRGRVGGELADQRQQRQCQS